MLRFLLVRLLIIPPALLVINVLGFIYSRVAWQANASTNPFYAVTDQPPPLLAAYGSYLQSLLRLDLGERGFGRGTVVEFLTEAAKATLGLLGIAFAISLVLGLLLGLWAVKTQPPKAAGWLIPISTAGLAMPSFFIGSLCLVGMVLLAVRGFGAPRFPFSGFGWDEHLVLPVIALLVRPTVQIAQGTSRLLAEEINKQYVIAARSLGYTWFRIRWKTALRNVIAPIILTITASFRVLLGELVLVEWLFVWPGLGRLLAELLVPPEFTSSMGTLYLDAPIVATVITVFGLLFLVTDFVASLLVRLTDPRLRETEGQAASG